MGVLASTGYIVEGKRLADAMYPQLVALFEKAYGPNGKERLDIMLEMLEKNIEDSSDRVSEAVKTPFKTIYEQER
ncbi:MAG: hypothetical protein WAZ18_04170 [Alphaproteobacteria bacterium]